MDHPATGVTYSGGTRTLAHSGLAKIYAGRAAARFFGVPASDPRHPDVFGRVQVGVVYTGGTKIAEHGGDNPGDRDVPIVVYAPGVRSRASDRWVETTSVAPTILKLLGLDPRDSRGGPRGRDPRAAGDPLGDAADGLPLPAVDRPRLAASRPRPWSC